MLHSLKATVKKPARKLIDLTQLPLAKWVKKMDIHQWPAWLGYIYGIEVPKGVVANPEPLPSGSANINIILELIEKTVSLEGNFAECGVFRGHTLLPLALSLRTKGVSKRVYGFDSFQGFDSAIEKDLKLGGAENDQKQIGGFSHTSYSSLVKKVRLLGLDSSIRLVKGYFKDTLNSYSAERFCFVHLDCDIYESYRECLHFFYPRMVTGGIILFDEYNDPPWPGCNQAVNEFLADKPERLQEIVRDNYVKYWIAKL
jgi:hypothetical protein